MQSPVTDEDLRFSQLGDMNLKSVLDPCVGGDLVIVPSCGRNVAA